MKEEDLAEINESIAKAVDGYLVDGKFDLDIAKLKIKIHLEGPKWTGRVDRPVAQFLIDLDRQLRKAFSAVNIDLPETEHGLIALRIEKGSLSAFIEYAPQIYEALSALAAPQKVVVLTTILTSVGLLKQLRSALREEEPARDHEEAGNSLEAMRANDRTLMLSQLKQIDEATPQLQAPLKNLIKTMDEKDRITLPGSPNPQVKEHAKEALSKKVNIKNPTTNYYIDHPYTVENLETKQSGKWSVTLRFGDFSFKAALALDPKDIDTLLAEYRTAHAQQRKIAPHLQVTADISSKGVKWASVMGIGAPRERSKNLPDVLREQNYKKKSRTTS